MRSNITLHTLLLVGLASLNTFAQEKGDADMTFHGTLIAPPPCTINNGNRIDVDFGPQVGISKVDGVNFRQIMNYQISCEQGVKGSGALRLTLSGNAAGFDKNALLTNKENLGIQVYQNDQPFTPGSTLKIDPNNPPRLEAVPVKKKGAMLAEGEFEAWATLSADYT